MLSCVYSSVFTFFVLSMLKKRKYATRRTLNQVRRIFKILQGRRHSVSAASYRLASSKIGCTNWTVDISASGTVDWAIGRDWEAGIQPWYRAATRHEPFWSLHSPLLVLLKQIRTCSFEIECNSGRQPEFGTPVRERVSLNLHLSYSRNARPTAITLSSARNRVTFFIRVVCSAQHFLPEFNGIIHVTVYMLVRASFCTNSTHFSSRFVCMRAHDILLMQIFAQVSWSCDQLNVCRALLFMRHASRIKRCIVTLNSGAIFGFVPTCRPPPRLLAESGRCPRFKQGPNVCPPVATALTSANTIPFNDRNLFAKPAPSIGASFFGSMGCCLRCNGTIHRNEYWHGF